MPPKVGRGAVGAGRYAGTTTYDPSHHRLGKSGTKLWCRIWVNNSFGQMGAVIHLTTIPAQGKSRNDCHHHVLIETFIPEISFPKGSDLHPCGLEFITSNCIPKHVSGIKMCCLNGDQVSPRKSPIQTDLKHTPSVGYGRCVL